MVRRRSPIEPGLRLLALTFACLAVQSGCGRNPAPAVSVLVPPRAGHVYVARLLTEHPLYEELQRLEQEIAALRRPLEPAPAPVLALELGGLFLPPLEAPRFPVERFEAQRRAWLLTLLPDVPVTGPGLAPDLQAELQWQRRVAEQQAQQRIAIVRSEQEATVARIRIAAVRARQEALNNAGLDLTLQGRDAGLAAQRERDRIWAEIEQETAEARSRAEVIIAQEQSRIEGEMRGRLDAAEAQIQERMKKRREITGNTGSENKTRMSNAIVPPQGLGRRDGLAWRPDPLPPLKAAPLPSLSATAADRRIRLAQAERMAAAKAELAAELYDATAVAVQRVAWVHHWKITLPPDEPARGSDMTERVRAEIRRMFHPDSS